MLQAKKLNASMIAVVVLSVLLAIAVSVGATLAWFADSDLATGTFGLTGAVKVALEDSEGAEVDTQLTDLTLVPSHPIDFDLRATVDETSTPYLVRARFILEDVAGAPTEGSDNYIAYTDARNAFVDFLKFDTAEENGFTWDAQLGTDEDGWHYLQSGESYVVGEIDALDGSDEPVIIPEADLRIIQGTRNVPFNWKNEYAGFTFNVRLEIQATQAEVYEPTGTVESPSYSKTPMLTESISNVQDIFGLVFGGGDFSYESTYTPGE